MSMVRFALRPVLALFVVLVPLCSLSLKANAFEVKSVTSPGGITAWLVEDHTIPLIAVNFSFAGGSAADPKGKEGVANFLSGMLDEGAGDMKSAAFQKKIQRLAVRLAFSSSSDEFTGSFQTLSRNRDAAFDLLKLAVTKPRFDQVPLDRVRSQIMVNIKNNKDDAKTVAFRLWISTMLGDHPYARDATGTQASVTALTSADLASLHKRLFTRDTLMVVAVGDIDEETFKKKLDDVFLNLPEKSQMPEIAEATAHSGPIVKVVKQDIPQSIIRFGLPGIKRDNPDFIPAYVMNFILGDGGFSSRLMTQVREKRGLSYSIYSTLYPFQHAGLIYGAAATVNKRAGETIKVIREEVARMAKDGPTAKELANAKTYLTGSYPLRFDSNKKIAGQLLSIQREKLGIDYVIKRNDMINAVTLGDVRRLAKSMLDADKLIFTIVGKPVNVEPQG